MEAGGSNGWRMDGDLGAAEPSELKDGVVTSVHCVIHDRCRPRSRQEKMELSAVLGLSLAILPCRCYIRRAAITSSPKILVPPEILSHSLSRRLSISRCLACSSVGLSGCLPPHTPRQAKRSLSLRLRALETEFLVSGRWSEWQMQRPPEMTAGLRATQPRKGCPRGMLPAFSAHPRRRRRYHHRRRQAAAARLDESRERL